MFGMLKVVLGSYSIALRTCVARKLQVFLIDVSRRAADLHIGPGRIERSVMILLLRPSAASA
jgi:hypothetical protein